MVKLANVLWFLAQMFMTFAYGCKKLLPAWKDLKERNAKDEFLKGIDNEGSN